MSEAGYLLDTNVISETRRPRPAEQVIAFLASIRDANVCVSVLTIGELRRGAEARSRKDPIQGARLRDWVESIETSYGDRALSVDLATAQLWGTLSAQRSRPVVDTLIAATALSHGMTLVTRNTADIRDTGVLFIDPWVR